MYCLANICYVCLETKDKSLINISSSLAVNKDIMHIIDYLPFNLGWMKTKQIILICEVCCRRLRETYHLLARCLKNSAVLQGYMEKLNTASISDVDNEAELRVDLNNKHDAISETKCEIKLEEEEIYTVGPIIEETEVVFMNVDDSFVKEEDTWNREEADDKEEVPMENNSTESSDKESSVNSNTHDTDTDSDSSESTSTQVHTTKKKKLNTPGKKSHKCLTCNKSFTTNIHLQNHKRVHKDGGQYKCATCSKLFRDNFDLVRHERVHTGEKPYECSICKKSFSVSTSLTNHMRLHTDEQAYKCDVCQNCFACKYNLDLHMMLHTGEKPHKCDVCKKSFRQQNHLKTHMMIHTGEKPYKCSRCNKRYRYKSSLMSHIKKCAL